VVGDVLDRDAAAQPVLDVPDAVGHMDHRRIGERQRHQVVELPLLVAAGAEVLAVDRALEAVQEPAQLVEECLVERSRASQRQREAMAGDGIAAGEVGEGLAECAADTDPVLRRRFQEVELPGRGALQFAQKAAPQAEAHGVVGKVMPGSHWCWSSAMPGYMEPHSPSPHLPSMSPLASFLAAWRASISAVLTKPSPSAS